MNLPCCITRSSRPIGLTEMFRHERCEQLIEMGAFWNENRINHHRINSLSTEQSLLPVIKHPVLTCFSWIMP